MRVVQVLQGQIQRFQLLDRLFVFQAFLGSLPNRPAAFL